MKRIFTLLCAAALIGTVTAQNITSVTVEKKAELTTALNDAATLSPGDIAYIYIKGDINLGSFTFPATTRNLHFVGIDNEDGTQACLRAEFVFPSNESENDGFAASFENLHLMDNNGEWGNSKHFINFKDANKHFVDTLAFRNCEISNICRSFVRCQINNPGEDFTGAGTFKHFEMTNCVFHNGSRQANAMPLIYMAQPTNTMVFRNNTFYDLTYLNALVTYNYMTDETGRQALKFSFENNTLVAWSKSTLFNFGAYVNNESEFHIKNNFFLYPNWVDEMNNRAGDTNSSHDMTEEATTRNEEGTTTFGYLSEDEVAARLEKGTVLTNIEGGLVQLEKNVLLGYKHQNMVDAIEAGDIITIGDTEEEEDTISFYTMEDVNFAWTDFADAQNDMFQINIAHPVYTAGVKGAPIGDERNYTDRVIKVVHVTTHVEGSTSASVSVAPQKDAYVSGDVVTLTANVNGSLNTFKSWSNGMTEPVIEITLEDDLDITATFEELDYVAVWNLDDLATNNVKKLSPLAANHGDESLTLNYMRYLDDKGYVVWNEENSAFVNDIEDADEKKAAGNVFMTRNNKVAGDIRNCFLITTSNTQFNLGAEGHADYLFIEAAETLQPTKIQFFAASDNIPYKVYAISTSTDGETWTDASTFEMSNNGVWNPIEAELPAAKFIRIKGVESEGMFITPEFQELIDAGTNSVNTEFLFVAEIILMPSDGQGIIETQSSTLNAQNSKLYNLMGIRVNSNASGLLIQNGKKHIVK